MGVLFWSVVLLLVMPALFLATGRVAKSVVDKKTGAATKDRKPGASGS